MFRLPGNLELLSAAAALSCLLAACTSDSVPDPTRPPSVAAVVFDPGSCSFQNTMQLALQCPTTDATIRYTTDGSDPSPTNGSVYAGPITLTRTTTIRAVALLDGFDSSPVVEASFTRTGLDAAISVSQPTVTGRLIALHPCELTITCTVTVTACVLESVTADLSQIGGPPAEPLVCYVDHWGWSGRITPPASGPGAITIRAASSAGPTGTSQMAVVVSPANRPPTPAIAALMGRVVKESKCPLVIACSAVDQDGQVKSVTADMSAAGGPSAMALRKVGDKWVGYAELTPALAGDMPVVLTATDDLGASQSVPATIYVDPPYQAPSVGEAAVSGTLLAGQPATVTVSCTTGDADGAVVSVSADLSQFGGPANQPLDSSGDRWTWSGTLTPPASGSRTVRFVATDSVEARSSASTQVTVGLPGALPSVSSARVSTPLVRNKPSPVTVSCVAVDPNGSVQSVTADLSVIGGSTAQPLSVSDGVWTWKGTLTPANPGTQMVRFVVTDDEGNDAEAVALVNVVTSSPGGLAGVWSGNVIYSDAWNSDSTMSHRYVVPTTRVFSTGFQPDSLTFFFLDPRVLQMPTHDLMNVGDRQTSQLWGHLRIFSPVTISATVRNVSRTSTSFGIDLDLDIEFGSPSGPKWFHHFLTGTHSYQATLGPNDTLICTERIHYSWFISFDITASGTLTRK